jgi:FixJ family two-component response regulator
LLAAAEFAVKDYPTAGAFLADDTQAAALLVTDLNMPEMGGLALLQEIARLRDDLPVVLITGHGEVGLAVHHRSLPGADHEQAARRQPLRPRACRLLCQTQLA